MEMLHQFEDLFLHLDKHLNEWAGNLGPWLYLLLFAIVFCETGLVVTPFLPGDSLLFAVGALAASDGSPLNVVVLLGLLIVAAVAGDAVNYAIGYHVGPRVFRSDTSVLFNKKHLLRTQEFYERYGGKTIILARFMPIIRTFAPFVAGIGRMRYFQFAAFNVIGGVAWVSAMLFGGYLVGNIPVVKENFSIIEVAIIVISVLPLVIEFARARREARRRAALAPEPADLADETPVVSVGSSGAIPEGPGVPVSATVPALAARVASAREETPPAPDGLQGQAARLAVASAARTSPSALTLTAPAPVEVVRPAPLSTVEVIAARLQGVFDTALAGAVPGAVVGAAFGLLFGLFGILYRGVFVNFVAVGVFGCVLWTLGGTFMGAGIGIAVGAVRGVLRVLKPQPEKVRK